MKNYVVKLIRINGDVGYFSRNHRWQLVDKTKATWLTHKEALRIMNHLRQPHIGLKAILEER